jgi:hypothetical protein
MGIDLPTTENNPARKLAGLFSEEQLARAIAYLELVKIRKIYPGPEIQNLFGPGTLLSWQESGNSELEAVQNRLAFAICIQQNNMNSVDEKGKPNFIRKQVNRSIFKYRAEVLDEYNNQHGRTNTKGRFGFGNKGLGR